MDKNMESTMHAGFMAIVMSGRHFLNTAMGVHYAAAMYGSSANQILNFSRAYFEYLGFAVWGSFFSSPG